MTCESEAKPAQATVRVRKGDHGMRETPNCSTGEKPKGYKGRGGEGGGGTERRVRHPHGEEIDSEAPKGLEDIFGHVGAIDAAVLVALERLHAMLADVAHGAAIARREPGGKGGETTKGRRWSAQEQSSSTAVHSPERPVVLLVGRVVCSQPRSLGLCCRWPAGPAPANRHQPRLAAPVPVFIRCSCACGRVDVASVVSTWLPPPRSHFQLGQVSMEVQDLDPSLSVFSKWGGPGGGPGHPGLSTTKCRPGGPGPPPRPPLLRMWTRRVQVQDLHGNLLLEWESRYSWVIYTK